MSNTRKPAFKLPPLGDGDEKKRIVEWLETILESKEEELRYFEAPLDPELIKDIRKMEEMLLRREVGQLKLIIKQIKML